MPASRISQPYPFSLAIDKLALDVHLGVTPEEQAETQRVYAWLTLYYPTVPDASAQDASQYQCYDALCQKMRAVVAEKPIALIEFLVGELYRAIRPEVDAEARIRIRLHKPLPESLVGYTVEGASAEYTDLPEGLL